MNNASDIICNNGTCHKMTLDQKQHFNQGMAKFHNEMSHFNAGMGAFSQRMSHLGQKLNQGPLSEMDQPGWPLGHSLDYLDDQEDQADDQADDQEAQADDA